ncbi:MAG: RNA polymerase sigma factor [Patescibacteria group bacterium]
MDEDLGELAKRAKAGDKDAFGRIYSLLLDKIYRFIYFLVSDEDVAYDLTQDTFVRAYRALPRYDAQRGAFSTFVYAIARNLVIDHQRKRINISLDLVGNVRYEENFEEKIDLNARSKKIHAVLKLLSKDDRELLILRYFEEMSFSEIAEIVGKKEGAVRVQVFRLLKSLKESLAGNI